MLGLIRSVTFNYSTLGCMLILYFALVRSKVEYASVVWNSITSTDANKLERIQQKFMALCFKRFFPQADYCYGFALEQLKLHTLQKRRYHLDALFLTQVYRGSILCPSALEIVGLRVLVRCIPDFPMFSVCSVSKNCPSTRCVSAANVVCKDVDVFGPTKNSVVETYSILNYWIIISVIIIITIMNAIITIIIIIIIITVIIIIIIITFIIIIIIIIIILYTNVFELELLFALTFWLCLCTFCFCIFIHAHFVIGHWAVKLACK
jgi:hypothetical protein